MKRVGRDISPEVGLENVSLRKKLFCVLLFYSPQKSSDPALMILTPGGAC